MKRQALFLGAIVFCSIAAAPASIAAAKIHLRVGETVFAASGRSIGYAPCETPPGAKPYLVGFPKPKLDANGVPKTLFSYRAGDALKVVAMHPYTWTFEGNTSTETFWTLETPDHHRFCVRESQVDDTVTVKR
jgi:hypothetical protein